jgi:predicted DNA-binding transcriptional regulator YafY
MAQKREINYLNSNHTLSRMAAMFGVSERTISRAIKK